MILAVNFSCYTDFIMADDQQPQDSQNIPASSSPSIQSASPHSDLQAGDTQTSDTAQRPESPELAVEETVPSELTVVLSDTERPDSPKMADESKPPPSIQSPEPPPPVAHDKSTDESQVAGEQSEPQVVADENQPVSSSADQRPDSPKMADADLSTDSPYTNLANEQPPIQIPPSTVSVEEKPPETPTVTEPPKEETPSQSIPSEIGQVEDTPSSLSPSNHSDLSDPTNPSDLSVSSSNLSIETPPVQVSQPEPSAAEIKSDIPETPKPDLSAEVPQSGTKVDIIVQSPVIQAPQDHQEAPKDASSIDVAKQVDSSASFKLEPPEQPQEAPLANLRAEVSTKEGADTQNSSPKSFGDLLSETNPPPTPPISSSLPPVSSPAPSVSFGDLIKDIEITPPVIPEAERPVEQQQPIPSSQPPPQTSSQPSPVSPQSSQLEQLPQITSQPQASAAVEISIDDKNEVERQIRERLKLEQIQRRQLAQQVKTQRIAKNLEKILALAKTKEYITNLDVRDFLHISQSAATNYLSQLVKEGRLKREGKSKYIRYHL